LSAGVWVGGEDRDIHFDFTSEGQGANMALPIWAIFMKKVYSDPKLGYSELDSFDVPEGYEYNCMGNEPLTNGDSGEATNSVFEDF